MTAAPAATGPFCLGSLLWTLVFALLTVAGPVFAEPPRGTDDNWALGDRGGGSRWWWPSSGGGGAGTYQTQNQGQVPSGHGDQDHYPTEGQSQGQGQGQGQGRDQGGPPSSPLRTTTASPLAPRLGRAFFINTRRYPGASCHIDLYCHGCAWYDAYCSAAMSVISTDPKCEMACACVVTACSPSSPHSV
ncbi:hypothetical protein PG991_015751 [Apiospora marii]|uniref:Uncharacterized protein n=1 Tax=Apiospora marii TaxID=335849 RepID=A0ABR1R2L0_9PEZI